MESKSTGVESCVNASATSITAGRVSLDGTGSNPVGLENLSTAYSVIIPVTRYLGRWIKRRPRLRVSRDLEHMVLCFPVCFTLCSRFCELSASISREQTQSAKTQSEDCGSTVAHFSLCCHSWKWIYDMCAVHI